MNDSPMRTLQLTVCCHVLSCGRYCFTAGKFMLACTCMQKWSLASYFFPLCYFFFLFSLILMWNFQMKIGNKDFFFKDHYCHLAAHFCWPKYCFRNLCSHWHKHCKKKSKTKHLLVLKISENTECFCSMHKRSSSDSNVGTDILNMCCMSMNIALFASMILICTNKPHILQSWTILFTFCNNKHITIALCSNADLFQRT